MDRILFGIFLFGLSLLRDTVAQIIDFFKGGYSDKVLREKVWDTTVTFTVGFAIVGGFIYFTILLLNLRK